MKKLISVLSCIAVFGATAVLADAPKDDCVVAVYENGALFSCANGVYENGAAYADVKLPEGGYIVKAFFTDSGIVELADGMLNPAAVSEPTIAPTTEPTAEPTTEPTKAPEKTPRPTYHPAYETEKDAVEAIAVVESVNVVDADGENRYRIEVLYQGAEAEFEVEDTMILSSAPDVYSELNGESVSVLKRGDVIMIACRPSGGIKRVDLVMRPVKEDIITSGENYGNDFEELFSKGRIIGGRSDWSVAKYGKKLSSDDTVYAFGVIRNKDKTTVELVNEDGYEDDAFYIDLSDNVIVYTCDVSMKNELSIGGAGDILRSEIVSSDKDEDDNIVVWEEGREYNYALVRVVDGTAVEMVVYTGYAE